MNPVERVIVAALRVRGQDNQDWTEIADWAHSIAETLRALTSAGSAGSASY